MKCSFSHDLGTFESKDLHVILSCLINKAVVFFVSLFYASNISLVKKEKDNLSAMFAFTVPTGLVISSITISMGNRF